MRDADVLGFILDPTAGAPMESYYRRMRADNPKNLRGYKAASSAGGLLAMLGAGVTPRKRELSA